MNPSTRRQHAWNNGLQSLLLVLVLIGIGIAAGVLLLGESGVWVAVGACILVLLIEPVAASQLTLRLYRAQPLAPVAAPGLWQILRRIAAQAGLPTTPALYYVPSPVVNAFAVGSARRSAIALSDGLLNKLTAREIAGVLAHETAHIAHGDLRVMQLADYVSRLTSLFSLLGQLLLLLALPWLLAGGAEINWSALLLLAASPHIALLTQLGLSRVREFAADMTAAQLTGDPMGLASALAKIEGTTRSWRSLLLPGWGNPEPSWLRTHPATVERIRRLQALDNDIPMFDTWPTAAWRPPLGAIRARHAPRWYIGGLWR